MNTFSDDGQRDPRAFRRLFGFVLFSGLLVTGAAAVKNLFGDEAKEMEVKAPDFGGISKWLNSPPLALKNLRGKVAVVHFWTFNCINCQHNLPYYNQWRADFPKDQVQIIGVHTPETPDEADAEHVADRVAKLGIKYPVAIDNDHATWKAYENRYWPAIYLIDKQGRVRYRWDGELDYQDAGGDKLMRAKIKELVAEGMDP